MVVAMSGLFLVARSGGYSLVAMHKLLIKPLQSKVCRLTGFSSGSTRAQPWWHTGLVALRMCNLPKPGIKPRVLCIGRWILIHWTTREVLPTLRQSPIYLSGFPAPTLSNPQSQSLSIFHPVSGIILSKLNAGQVALSFKSLHWISVSVQFSRTVMSNSLRSHELQHTRPPCLSPTPRVHPNPCPLSQ